MHSGARMKDYMGLSNNVVMALDDSEMDNDNDNVNTSGNAGSGGGGGGGINTGPGGLGSSSLSSSGASAAHYQAWSWYPSSLFGGPGTSSGGGSSRDLSSMGPNMTEFEVDNSSIDLDTYVTGFTGVMRINRLLFVAEHCPGLRIDALRMALNFVMETFNVQLYNVIHKQLTDAFAKL